jgi:hypothetical protein
MNYCSLAHVVWLHGSQSSMKSLWYTMEAIHCDRLIGPIDV